jgi:hypothetical protein
MKIGILGSGLMGGKLGTLFSRVGHEVVFSSARSEEKLKRLARDAKGHARAGTPAEAVRDADAVLLAVHWQRIDDVLKQAGDLSGKSVMTCSLPMNADDRVSSSGTPCQAPRNWRRRSAADSAHGAFGTAAAFRSALGAREAHRRTPRTIAATVRANDGRGMPRGPDRCLCAGDRTRCHSEVRILLFLATDKVVRRDRRLMPTQDAFRDRVLALRSARAGRRRTDSPPVRRAYRPSDPRTSVVSQWFVK